MIGGIHKIDLTKEYILTKCSEKEIYEFYWKPFKLGHIYHSPLRKDSIPSFGIYRTAAGTLRHHDFGDKQGGNCFSFVSTLFGLNLRQTLEKINHDLCLGKGEYTYSEPKVEVKKFQTNINILAKNFTKEELGYWNQYSQDISDLKKNEVYSVDKLFINNKKIDILNELCFAYLFYKEGEEYLKIYRPYAKNRMDKWRYNGPNTLVSGWDRVQKGGNRLIILGSKKDEMCIRKLTEDCVSTQSESETSLTEDDRTFIVKNWNKKIIAFDSDKRGVEASTYYNQFGFGWVNVPKTCYKDGVKDIADFTANYGLGQLQYFLKNKGVL